MIHVDHPERTSAEAAESAARNANAPAAVVSLPHYRLARKIAETGRRQGELAQMLRSANAEREQLAGALRGTQRRLARIAESYRELLGRLERERVFRDACREAAELDDLDEMIRRRDELALQLEKLRLGNARRLELV